MTADMLPFVVIFVLAAIGVVWVVKVAGETARSEKVWKLKAQAREDEELRKREAEKTSEKEEEAVSVSTGQVDTATQEDASNQ